MVILGLEGPHATIFEYNNIGAADKNRLKAYTIALS